MRSRYSAYVKGAVDYIMNTHHPDKRDTASREATEKWMKESEWMGLDILEVHKGAEADTSGTVEFEVRYRGPKRAIITHHEKSTFQKKEGLWYFKEAQMINNPQTRETPKIGRNDLCPCGSGKKYKKCHGA